MSDETTRAYRWTLPDGGQVKFYATPSVAEVLCVLPVDVADAVVASHTALRDLGVPHALCGGVAMAAYGYVRTTRDVDWLTGDDAFERRGLMVVHRPGVPIAVGPVRVDYVPLPGAGDYLRADLLVAAPVEVIIHTKLIAGRMKDRADVLALVEAGAEPSDVVAYLHRAGASKLLPKFENILREGR